MASGTLYESNVVTLDGSGNGTVKAGPLTAREVWNPVTASVKANANPTNEAQCTIYVGLTATAENFRDQTFTGSSGDATDKVVGRLPKGQFVWAVWSGGDAGQQARLVVTGTKEI
jgi:hypothetical protein